jgi:uncharacterized protein (TIGR02722 family)
MTHFMVKGLKTLAMLASFTTLAACTASTRNIDTSSETHYNAYYDFSDKNKIVTDLTASLLRSDIAYNSKKPILIVYGVANETSEHISTSGITDDIRLELIRSGRYRFINKVQRESIASEVAYQKTGTVEAIRRIEQGKQLGADYILAGTLRSIEKTEARQWRLFKKEIVVYSLHLEMTNLITGEITWADKVELARESSKPIFRW